MRRYNSWKLFLLLVLTVVVLLFSLYSGQVDIPFSRILAVLAYKCRLLDYTPDAFSLQQLATIWYIRMPRTIVGFMVGAALAVCGAVMQGIFSNPLADPGIMGVSSGASAGAVIAIALGASSMSAVATPLCAFLGALGAVALTVGLASRHGKVPVMTLLLSGVAVGMLLGAVTSGVLTFMNEQKVTQFLFWMVGGLDYRSWHHVWLALPPLAVGLGIMFLLARHLNILVLGEVEAKAVGMPVLQFRLGMLAVASLTTATAVCVSGNIGFVGLVVPHMMRLLVGADHRITLPASALAGGIFLVFCDALGRLIIAPAEIRVGVMTAILGTPYFLYLLRQMR